MTPIQEPGQRASEQVSSTETINGFHAAWRVSAFWSQLGGGGCGGGRCHDGPHFSAGTASAPPRLGSPLASSRSPELLDISLSSGSASEHLSLQSRRSRSFLLSCPYSLQRSVHESGSQPAVPPTAAFLPRDAGDQQALWVGWGGCWLSGMMNNFQEYIISLGPVRHQQIGKKKTPAEPF